MKTFNILFLVFFTFKTFGQITKGNWLIGGDGKFKYDKFDKTNTSVSGIKGGSLKINLGNFIIDKLAIGVLSSHQFSRSYAPQLDGTTI